MPRPTLEYINRHAFTLVGPVTPTAITMTGPTGTKGAITVLTSGTGTSSGVAIAEFKTGSSTIGSCTKIGSFNMSSPTSFVDLWYVLNVPIASTSTLNLYGTAGVPGYAEVGYWDGTRVDALFAAAPATGMTGGYPPSGPGIGGIPNADDVVYGLLMGTTVSDWYLAGGPMMETIYPSYGTTPPTFTNSGSVLVGQAMAGSTAPKVCSGFIREPNTAANFWAFSFATSTTWNLYLLTIRGHATVAAPSQLVTILG